MLKDCVKDGIYYKKVAQKNTKDNIYDGDNKKKLSACAIAGIVIACVVVVAAIIALLVFYIKFGVRRNL